MTDVDKLLAVIDNLQQCAEEAAPGSKQHHLLKESLSKLHDMELSQSHLASLRDLASGHRSTPDDGKKLVQLIHNIHKRKKHLGADEKKYEERQFLDSSLSTLYGTDIYKEFLGSSYEKSHENLFCDTERVLKLKSDLEALKRLLNRESESWSKCQQIIDDSMATLSSTDVYKSKVESLPGVASSDFKTFCEMIEKLRNRRDEEREKMEKQSEDEGAEREHDESRPFFDDSIAILYDMTACRSYLASLSDNSLAYISSDIIHDLVAPVEDHTLLKNLAETTGNWGSVAQRRDSFLKNHVRELSMQIRCEGEREIMHEQLPKCYGKLALFDLCRWLDDAEAQKMIEESQDAYFSDLCLHWHYHVGESVPVPAEFKNFILKHLKSN
ncbi:hypothetical protein QR680_011212 [Steinernema hermaphroditum]|uniref:Uncharacterized protein n=1 Tax=Steinernema hermaphroditum TaxID=289476 RepID=A0AA39MD31_9BILA|nr:hypothetical protein QR680_011212 [Steinernema hermaphroditum]